MPFRLVLRHGWIVYANALLATLNARKMIRNCADSITNSTGDRMNIMSLRDFPKKVLQPELSSCSSTFWIFGTYANVYSKPETFLSKLTPPRSSWRTWAITIMTTIRMWIRLTVAAPSFLPRGILLISRISRRLVRTYKCSRKTRSDHPQMLGLQSMCNVWQPKYLNV